MGQIQAEAVPKGEAQAGERRSRGRPQLRSDEQTQQLIVEAAAHAFQANGYAATSMNAVAQQAGVSTKTMYRLFSTKMELFSCVIAARIGRFVLALDEDRLAALEPLAALEHILTEFGTLTLDQETIAINHLVIGEGDRCPEIAATFYRTAILPTTALIETWLRRQCEHGVIRLEDPHIAAEMLRGMMIMDPQRAVMLHQRPALDAAEIARRARLCATLFMDGCRA